MDPVVLVWPTNASRAPYMSTLLCANTFAQAVNAMVETMVCVGSLVAGIPNPESRHGHLTQTSHTVKYGIGRALTLGGLQTLCDTSPARLSAVAR